jgi:hypothetical protein
MGGKSGTKAQYFEKLKNLLETYKVRGLQRKRVDETNSSHRASSSSASTMSPPSRCTKFDSKYTSNDMAMNWH